MTDAALVFLILKLSGQELDEMTLSEAQSLWKTSIRVLRAPNIPVTTRFLSFESLPY